MVKVQDVIGCIQLGSDSPSWTSLRPAARVWPSSRRQYVAKDLRVRTRRVEPLPHGSGSGGITANSRFPTIDDCQNREQGRIPSTWFRSEGPRVKEITQSVMAQLSSSAKSV